MIDIIPGINEKNFDELTKQVRLVSDLVDWIHFDILDNTLIHESTYNNWIAIKSLQVPNQFEAHLMVADPLKYVKPLVDGGFKRLIAHVEAHSVREFIDEAKIHEVEVGVALDGPTELEVIEPFLDEIDTVLVMMYKAGPSGQSFQHEQIVKIRKIHESYPHLPIEVDGGIDKGTAPLVKDAGATRLVSTSYLFWKNPERMAEAIEELRG